MPIDKPIEEQNTQMSGEQYQQMLGTESYKQLLQADLQAENAKNVALRNTNMALQNAGLQGNAYGGTLASSTSNAYLTALQQNMSDFGNNIGQESEKNMLSIQNTLDSVADDKDRYMNMLGNLGITDDNGKLNFDGYEGYLTDTQKQSLQAMYEDQLIQWENGNNANVNKDYINNTFKDTNGVEYSSSYLGSGTGYGSRFDINIGDYTVEAKVGEKISHLGNAGNKFSKDINDYPKNAKEGQIAWVTTKKGNQGAFVVYSDGDWHLVEMRNSNGKVKKSQFKELANKLGVDLSKYEFNWNTRQYK